MKRGFLIDMDGVIYSGEEMIQGADVFINHLITSDILFAFMTNLIKQQGKIKGTLFR